MYTEWIAITALLAVVIVVTGRAAMKDEKNLAFLSPPPTTTELVITGSQVFPTPTPSLSESTSRPDNMMLGTEIPDAPTGHQLTSMAAEFAELLRHSYWARAGSLSEVETRAHRLRRLLPDDTDVAEFADLALIAARILQADAGS